jgi:hypothetical protein
VYLVTGRSLRSSRKSEFSENGHSQLPTGNVHEFGTERSLAMRLAVRSRPRPVDWVFEKQTFNALVQRREVCDASAGRLVGHFALVAILLLWHRASTRFGNTGSDRRCFDLSPNA